ncbi:MAG: heparan-alpha-glucosaminide N-acetyltransferase [Rhizobiaceae bacterium]
MQTAQPRRIETIDLVRGAALVAMAIYHFTWDLEFFGYVEPGLTAVGGWKLFARCIASSFLFLVGVSLVLAHGDGVRWTGFWKRFAMVAGAALAISAVTFAALPAGGIFFGILHQIAFASVAGLAFLRLPPVVTLVAAAMVVAAPHFLRSEAFDHPLLWWTGLSTVNPRSNDFVPVFPWFGAVLAGMGAAGLGRRFDVFTEMAKRTHANWSRPLRLAGRHSLGVYLVHQPVLIGLIWVFSQAIPPVLDTPEVAFRKNCERQCLELRDEDFCTRYCVCFLEEIDKEGDAEAVLAGEAGPETQARFAEIAAWCTAETDGLAPEEGQ